MSKNEELWVYMPGKLHAETVLRDGRGMYSGKSEKEYLDEGFKITGYDEFHEQLTKTENEKYTSKPWIEITEDEWWDMYEVLPPMKDTRLDGWHFFFISEATTSNIHACFCEIGDRYFTASRRTSTPYQEMILEIEEQFYA